MKFSITKKSGGKGKDQLATTNSVVLQSDPEMENLEQQCYAELLECCKKMAAEAGVNYTTIMNLQVRFSIDTYSSSHFQHFSRVFQIKALKEMSKRLPESEGDMMSIPHVTRANYLKYGDKLKEITSSFSAAKASKKIVDIHKMKVICYLIF